MKVHDTKRQLQGFPIFRRGAKWSRRGLYTNQIPAGWNTYRPLRSICNPPTQNDNTDVHTQKRGSKLVETGGEFEKAPYSPPQCPQTVEQGEGGGKKYDMQAWSKTATDQWISGSYLWTTMYKYKPRSQFSFRCFNLHMLSTWKCMTQSCSCRGSLFFGVVIFNF